MSEATLAIRPGESIYVSDEPFVPIVGEHEYMVAFLLAPPMPEPHHHPDDEPLAVVAIQKYTAKGETQWGWIHITPESKAEIGGLLAKANAVAWKWYWLLVSPLSDRI